MGRAKQPEWRRGRGKQPPYEPLFAPPQRDKPRVYWWTVYDIEGRFVQVRATDKRGAIEAAASELGRSTMIRAWQEKVGADFVRRLLSDERCEFCGRRLGEHTAGSLSACATYGSRES